MAENRKKRIVKKLFEAGKNTWICLYIYLDFYFNTVMHTKRQLNIVNVDFLA